MRSASVKQLLHLAQLIKNGDFKQFDYGNVWENRSHYNGNQRPPAINLKNIPDIPIALLVGKYDTLADKTDVQKLADELGIRVTMHKEYDDFDHFGFSVGKDMSWTKDVLDLLKKVEGNIE